MFDFLNKLSSKELEKELIRQLTFSNWLRLLDSQYTHPDSFMTITEIQYAYEVIYKELKETTNLSKLENKD